MIQFTKDILINCFEGKKLSEIPVIDYKERIINVEGQWDKILQEFLDTFQTPEEKERYRKYLDRT